MSRCWHSALAVVLAFGLTPFAKAQNRDKAPAETGETKSIGDGARIEPDSAERIRQRAAWFYDQRAYPLGYIPAGARLRALEQLRQMKAAQKTGQFQAFQAIGGGATWASIGPQPTSTTFFQPFTSGRATALVVDPLDPTGNTAYLGAAFGGVWKTTNGGSMWTPLTDFQASLAVGSIALGPPTSPNTVSTIYVGTGEENFAGDSYYGAGVLKSVDGGATWTQDHTFTAITPISSNSRGPRIGALAVDPINPQILLAAVRGFESAVVSGIWCSQDAGSTWTQVLPAAGIFDIPGTDVAFSKDGSAYVALGSPLPNPNNGVYKSAAPVNSCSGISWNVQSLPFAGQKGRIALAVAPSDANTVFAAVADGFFSSLFLLGVAKTSNATSATPTWSALTGQFVTETTGFCNPQCVYDLVIRVSPSNPNLVFAGGAARNATLIRSTDGGATWAEVSNSRPLPCTNCLHVDMHALAFSADGNLLYAGNDGGVWSTTNPAGTPIWTNLNQTLAITQFYPGFSDHPSNPAFRSFGGTQDNGTQKYVGNPTWIDLGVPCDGGYSAIDSQVPSTIYATCQFIAIFKSLLNGDAQTLFRVDLGIDRHDRLGFIAPLAIDSRNPQRLYFGTCRVWQTTDGGSSWNAISPDLTGNGVTDCSIPGGGVLKAIAVAPGDSNTIYTGASDSLVFVTTTGGASPSACGSPWCQRAVGLPPRTITAIAVDPTSPQTAYVTFSGFSTCSFCDNLGHVFQTLTGGTTWTDITGTGSTRLPDIPVNDIVIDPDVPNTLYVATDIGVFVGSNANPGAGTTWSPLGTGLPNVAVLSLKLHRSSRTLLAATHGRSVWELELPPVSIFNLATISPASDNAGDSSSPALVVSGNGFTSNSAVKWTINGATDILAPASTPTATQFSVAVPPKDLGASGVAQVQVFDPSQPAPGTTNSLPFTVVNPAPTVNSISPQSLAAPAISNLLLTVTGANFNSGSLVQLSQLEPLAASCLTSLLVNSEQLNASVQQSCLQFGGEFVVTVTNQLPGGGSSCPSRDVLTCPASDILVMRAPPPANDAISSATAIGTNNFSITEDNSGATANTGGVLDPMPPLTFGCEFVVRRAVSGGVANSVWFKFTANGDGPVEVDTIGSAYDTILSVWSNNAGMLSPVACNDDINPGVNRVSQLSFSASFNTTYFIMVSAFEGDGGKTILNLNASLTPPPDYGASATAFSPATVPPGSAATSTITFTSKGFSGTIAPTCSSIVPATSTITCSFSPLTVMLSGNGTSGATTLSVHTVARGLTSPPGSYPRVPLHVYRVWIGLVAILLFAVGLARCGSPRRRWGMACACLMLLALLTLQISCGGGGGSSGGGSGLTGTQPGTYTITVSGTPAAPSGSTTVTLTVQ